MEYPQEKKQGRDAPGENPDIKGELKRIFDVKVKHNRSIFVFLICFAGVFAIWFLKQVENGYVMSATISPVYVNTPTGYTSGDLSRQPVKIAVQMNGFNMLSYAVGSRSLEVDLNKVVRQAHGRHFWIPGDHPELLSSAVLRSDRIEQVMTDTIYLNMGDEVSKVVPVVASRVTTAFRPGYGSFSAVTVHPIQVKLFGTPEEVEQIREIVLPELHYRGLSAPMTDSVRLSPPPGLRKVRIEPEKVAVSVDVKPYTEGEMMVPVRAINVPRGYAVRLFPSKVRVRYRVAVEDYARLAEKDLRVTADMEHTDPDTRYVYLKITDVPSFVGKVTVVPEKVQYVYKKR